MVPAGIRSIVFESIIPSLQAQVDILKAQGVNKIVVLGHGGILTSKAVAARVTDVDIVVDGRTNTFLYNGRHVGCSAGENIILHLSALS